MKAIDAASFDNMKLNGFGISISGKVDVDRNGYPGLLLLNLLCNYKWW